MSDEYKLSNKYKDFIKHNAPVECLEGTTAAGKTTVGILKFMLQVAKSKKKQHVIAAKTTGVAEKNIYYFLTIRSTIHDMRYLSIFIPITVILNKLSKYICNSIFLLYYILFCYTSGLSCYNMLFLFRLSNLQHKL